MVATRQDSICKSSLATGRMKNRCEGVKLPLMFHFSHSNTIWLIATDHYTLGHGTSMAMSFNVTLHRQCYVLNSVINGKFLLII